MAVGKIGVIRDSPVWERLCPLVVGEEAAVRDGESMSVKEAVMDDSEYARCNGRGGGWHL